ncbi:hypothetical protein AOA80_01800 [Methanomassiliicoccales archaeon RumEn M1]|jgi:hypothetical protein|nr:hypothetical protein AOA80_01800 [Methanomassiliicoccales archaeon RumEn M1]
MKMSLFMMRSAIIIDAEACVAVPEPTLMLSCSSIKPSPAAHPTTPLHMSFRNEVIGDNMTSMAKSMIQSKNALNAFTISFTTARMVATADDANVHTRSMPACTRLVTRLTTAGAVVTMQFHTNSNTAPMLWKLAVLPVGEMIQSIAGPSRLGSNILKVCVGHHLPL